MNGDDGARLADVLRLEDRLNAGRAFKLVDRHDSLLGGVGPVDSVFEDREARRAWHLLTAQDHHSMLTVVVDCLDVVQQRVAPEYALRDDVGGDTRRFVGGFGDDRSDVCTVHVSSKHLTAVGDKHETGSGIQSDVGW